MGSAFHRNAELDSEKRALEVSSGGKFFDPLGLAADPESKAILKLESQEKKTRAEILSNQARVVSDQEKYMKFREDSRYLLAKRSRPSGFVLLKDVEPSEPVELVANAPPAIEEWDPPPPESFEYVP